MPLCGGEDVKQSDCEQAIKDSIGTGDGLKLYAESILKLSCEMAKLPSSAEEDKNRVLGQMSGAIAVMTALMHQIDPNISGQLGESVTHVTDMFDDLSTALDPEQERAEA